MSVTQRRTKLDGHRGWRTKCHTIDCTHNTFLLLQKLLTSGTELILIGWKIVPNEENVQCDHRFASQPLANEPLAFVTTFQHKSSESARHNFTMWTLSYIFWPPKGARKCSAAQGPHSEVVPCAF